MKATTILRLLAIAVVVLPVGAAGPNSGQNNQSAAAQLDQRRSEPSTTLLPDGRRLVLGGIVDGQPSSRAALVSRDGAVQPLSNGMARPRVGHTATVLPSGRVLIFGGLDAQGRVVQSVETFDPETSTFSTERVDSLTPRAFHVATVTTDGRVAVAGGTGDDGRESTRIELWDPIGLLPTARATLPSALAGMTARLLPDGRVAYISGQQAALFDPAAGRVDVGSVAAVDAQMGLGPGPVAMAASPPSGYDELPLEPLLGIRFSHPVQVAPGVQAAVRLEGQGGAVADVRVVQTEEGLLAFVSPLAPLIPNQHYVLVVDGLTSAQGVPIPPARIEYRTTGDPNNPERWAPTDEDLGGLFHTGRGPSRWQALAPLTAPPGVTALAGQVLRLDGEPLARVALSIDGTSTQTDDTGRFLLSTLTPGHHEVLVDGDRNGGRTKSYGVYEIGVDIEAAKTTVLPYTIWLTALDREHAIRIPSPTQQETVITTPLLPGLELRLPPNAIVKDHDGKVVREISITPIPLDRPPFPLPKGVNVPLYFTIQPGAAYVYVNGGSGQRGARLIYPNSYRQIPGTAFDFWDYNADGPGWFVYGTGAVTPDGQQVAPNPGVEIYEFTGAMVTGAGYVPIFNPSIGGAQFTPPAGDPVDLATGLFVYSKTDLALDAVIPITLTRTYRQNDYTSRAFGRGTNHPYDIFIQGGAGTAVQLRIITPEGGDVVFDQTAGIGNPSRSTWVFKHTKSPSMYHNAEARWDGTGWTVTLRDGMRYAFLDGGDQSNPQQGGLRSIQDRFGNRLTVSRGVRQRINSIVSGTKSVTFTYDAQDRIKEAHDNIGRVVLYDYDALTGVLTQVTDASGGVTAYHYNDLNQMAWIRDPRGITFLTNYYGSSGRIYKQVLGDGATYLFDYVLNATGVASTTVTDPRSVKRTVVFNANGYATSDTSAVGRPEQQLTTFVWDTTKNLLQEVVNPLGQRTTYTYNSNGSALTTTSMVGTSAAATTTFTYHPVTGDVATVTDPLSHTSTFLYDSKFALQQVIDPLSHVTTFANNGRGQPYNITDAASRQTSVSYTADDVDQVTDPTGATSRAFADAAGRTASRTDARGRSVKYSRDNLNQLTAVTDEADAVLSSFDYDENGNLKTVTDELGRVTRFAYDNGDRLFRRTDPLGRSDVVSQFDPNGNVLVARDRRGAVTTYTYDALNRVASSSVVVAGQPSLSRSTSYAYDALNRLTQASDSQTGVIQRSYNDVARAMTETTPLGSTTWTFDAAGRRVSLGVSGQPLVSYSYDAGDRLRTITQGGVSVGIDYDELNRRTLLTLPGGLSVAYAYHPTSGRLSGTTYHRNTAVIGTLTYEYDAVGRRTSVGGSWARTQLPAPVTADYDDANQLRRWGTATVAYDPAGHLASDGVRSYTWDGRGQLAAITGAAAANFIYDGLGQRIEATVGGATTRYRYDGQNPVVELDGANAVKATTLTGLGLDEVYQRTTGAGTRTLLGDAIGSVLAEIDGAGAEAGSATYGPFGETQTTGTQGPSRWTGREDDGTGVYYFRARYYSPQFGRFLSEDPLGFAAGDTNLHAYASNDPVNLTDPTGQIVPILVPIILSCAGGATFDMVWNLAENTFAGRKSITEGTWGAAASGCISGLIGDGLGYGLRYAFRWAAKSGTVVIGENMARVEGYASRIGAETFQGTGMEANRLWIQEARSVGKQVFDIGPDFARRVQRVEQGIRPDSIFYNMERMETTGYENYLKVFVRTGKYTGGVP